MNQLLLQISVHLLTESLSWAVLFNNICWFGKVNEQNLITWFLWRVNYFTQQETDQNMGMPLVPVQFDYRLPLSHKRNDSDHRVIQVTNILTLRFHNRAEYPVPSGSRLGKAAAQNETDIAESSHAATQTELISSFQTQMPLIYTIPRCPEENMVLYQAKAIKWEHFKAVIFMRRKTNLLFRRQKC